MMGEHKRIRQHKEDDDEDRHPRNPSAPGPSRPGYYGYSPYQEPDYQYPPYLLPATHAWRRYMSKAGEPAAKGGSRIPHSCHP
jgi:hypothetical protein